MITKFQTDERVLHIIKHLPWLNTALFLIGENDLDSGDNDWRFYRDLIFAFMNIGRILLKYGIKVFFVPLQNRRQFRHTTIDIYERRRDEINFQLSDHFNRNFGYPALISSLSYTDRTLTRDGVHFTQQDYQDVATEINLHLTRHRLSDMIPQSPLEKHEVYLAEVGDEEQGEVRIEVQWDSDIDSSDGDEDEDLEVEEEVVVEYIEEEVAPEHVDMEAEQVIGRGDLWDNSGLDTQNKEVLEAANDSVEVGRGDIWGVRGLYTIDEEPGNGDAIGDIWDKEGNFSGNIARNRESEQACGITSDNTMTIDSGEQGDDKHDQNNNTEHDHDNDQRTQRTRRNVRGRHREGRCLGHQCAKGRE